MDFNGKAKDALVRFNLGLYCQFCEDAIAIWRKIAASQLKVGCNQFGKCNFAALWWSKWYSSQTIFTFSSAHFFTSALLKSKLKWILTLQLHPYLIEYNLYNFVHLTGVRQNIWYVWETLDWKIVLVVLTPKTFTNEETMRTIKSNSQQSQRNSWERKALLLPLFPEFHADLLRREHRQGHLGVIDWLRWFGGTQEPASSPYRHFQASPPNRAQNYCTTQGFECPPNLYATF